jgi:hypothetical protein
MDPETPFSWQELIVDLTTLDMIDQNTLYDKLYLPDSYSTYSYDHLKGKQDGIVQREKFVKSI